MTTLAHRPTPATRLERIRSHDAPKKYDIRVVDQFYVYCQAVARTQRHRDALREHTYQAMKRSLWTLLIAGGFLFYYLVERVAQAMSLY